MSIVVTKQKPYAIAEEGIAQAVLADVVDLGEVQTQFGPKEKIRLVWLTDQDDPDGKPIRVIQQFTKSLHEKSGLYKTIKSIYGRDVVADSVELDDLIGSNVRLVIEHNESDGKTYANVTAILRLEKGTPALEVPSDFVRHQDRKTNGNSNGKASGSGLPRSEAAAEAVRRVKAAATPATETHGTQGETQTATITDDDIPF